MAKGTTGRNNVRVGRYTGIPSTQTIGAVQLQQTEMVSAVASVAAHMFNLPASAE